MKCGIFLDKYKVHGDKERACVEAGFPLEGLDSLLTSPGLSSAIERIDFERLTGGRGEILSKMERETVLSRIIRDDGESVQHRLRAIELLGKAQGDYVERKEIAQAIAIRWEGSPAPIRRDDLEVIEVMKEEDQGVKGILDF